MAVTGVNVTAFANPDGTFATQILNNGNTTRTITVTGLTVPNRQNAVSGYLTNAAKDLMRLCLLAKIIIGLLLGCLDTR